MFACNQNYVCENYIGSVYGGLTERGLCVFCNLCTVGLLVVCECSPVLLQFVVMSYVYCGDDV